VNFIIFDLEATCWAQRDDSQVQEIIEIGALLINRYGEAESTFNSFIKPIVNPFLSDFCTELTSIRQVDVGRAPYFPEAIEDFMDKKHESSRISNLLYKLLFCNHLGFGCQLLVVSCSADNY
jgi:inhibitor of KinA sporulation pathway (predicted exonuclease)